MKFKKLLRNKKFELAVVIVFILTIAFFIGSNNDVVPLDTSEVSVNEHRFDGENFEEEETDLDKNEDEEDEEDKEDSEEEDKESEENDEKEQDQIREDKKTEQVKEQKVQKEQIIAQDNKNNEKKDKYKTNPVPEGKPKPKEAQDAKIDKEKKMTVTLSISAKTILNNIDMFDRDKMEVLPRDGVIYESQKVEFFEGESVFDVLLRETRKNKIHMEFNMTPVYNSNYVEAINNIYEFDCGELSGWMYKVNGWFPNYGSSRYELKDGDKIEWQYTCDLGRDIGGEKTAGGN